MTPPAADHLGALGGEVDAGALDPRHAGERLLHPGHAGGAVHPVYLQGAGEGRSGRGRACAHRGAPGLRRAAHRAGAPGGREAASRPGSASVSAPPASAGRRGLPQPGGGRAARRGRSSWARERERIEPLAEVGERAGVAQRLQQLGDLGVTAAGGDRLGDARLQVVLEQHPVDLLQRGLERGNLLHQIRAIVLSLDHGDDAVEVPAHRLEAEQGVALVFGLHPEFSISLPGWGGACPFHQLR